ncbi:MAG TPA: serine/threonine-protein kinase [Ktedonobacteraceae bacterium]|nr:serine/threonine-protein kinase [Ktedonobacteraceae bacterium]
MIMHNAELERISASLAQAGSAEEVFGTLVGSRDEQLEAAKRLFRQMAKAVHPDLFQERSDFDQAGAAFKKLVYFWEQAQTRIEHGTYGTAISTEEFVPFSMRTKKSHYAVERLLARGDISALYIAASLLDGAPIKCLLKIPVRPEDNDLLSNEARILTHLHVSQDYPGLHHFVSQLVDSFAYQEQASGILRQINILSYLDGFYSLKEVRQVYPQGVDPRHMAWIWRRLLVALGFAHSNNVIHGAVLPTHVLIHPRLHGVILIDWSYAVLAPSASGESISAISRDYRDWYPAEVFVREVPLPGLDIAMAARCMIDLLGGDYYTRAMPDSVPWQIQSHLKGCTLPNPRQRPQDARVLLADFDALIQRLWGGRTFQEFSMP